jgi:hypothetical protein
LRPNENISEFFSKNKENGKEPEEMLLVTFVKYYEISKEDFEKATKNEEKIHNQFGENLYLEDYELPNADIIYTFDNEIINEYYRRE